MSLRRSMIFSLGGAPPLDQVNSTALFAYGLRKLRTAYTGPCLRVRNSVGARGDLAFDANGEISTSSVVTITNAAGLFLVNSTHNLSEFANGGDVTVQTWYDQSSGARHIIQGTVANQPFLMQSGNFRLVDNKPSIYSPFTSKQLRYTGNCADYYNLVNNLGPLTIVKHSSTSIYFESNQIGLWGVSNFTADSGGVCTTASSYYAFGVANNQVVNEAGIGIGTRANPNVLETCGLPYSACTVRSIIPIGSPFSSTLYDGGPSKIVSITDDNGNKIVKSYINGSLSGTRGYECNLVRHPFINTASSFFFIGNVNTPVVPQSGAGVNIDYSFQEFIAFNGTNYHAERSVIEQSMGRYYNVTV